MRKGVAVVTKQAFTYVFDRVTGEPVFPIEERPVHAGLLPGEWVSPTQPFPTKPPPFEYQGLTDDTIMNLTLAQKKKIMLESEKSVNALSGRRSKHATASQMSATTGASPASL